MSGKDGIELFSCLMVVAAMGVMLSDRMLPSDSDLLKDDLQIQNDCHSKRAY